MKTKIIFKEISALMIAATMSIYQINAQTHGAGAINTLNGVGTVGTSHCFIGSNAGNANTTGSYNAFVGDQAGKSNDIGSYNSFFGYGAGYSNAAHTYGGHDHTFIGFQAGYYSGSGDAEGTATKNTFVGSQAGFNSNIAAENVFVGYHSGYNNTGAHFNVAIGVSTLYSQSFNNDKGTFNVAVGNNALYSTNPSSFTNGYQNTAIGHNAGYYNVTGSNNTIAGFEAGKGVSTNSHSNNSFFGFQAGYSTSSGSYNAFMGSGAGYTNNTGAYNSIIGYQAGYKNTSGSYNSFVGTYTGYSTTTSSSNNAFGFYALTSNTTGGGFNNAFGNNALGLTTGTANTAIGDNAGQANTTGSYNTFVGYGATATATTYSNCAAIGNGAPGQASNSVNLGNTTVTKIYGQVTGITGYSDGRFKNNVKENVQGLAFIKKLRPVTYQMDTKKLDDYLIQNMPDSIKSLHQKGMDFTESTSIVHSGFIAQEVEQAGKDIGFVSSIVSAPSNSTNPYGLVYAEFVVPLVKAVQELSNVIDSVKTVNTKQDSINKALGNQNAALQNQLNQQQKINAANDSVNAALQSQLTQLAGAINSCCTANSSGSLKSLNDSTSNRITVNLQNVQTVVLSQNSPNPFAQQTTINYYLPTTVVNAQMLFYDMQGQQIQTVNLTQRGNGSIIVFGQDLSSGNYTYTLVADGQIMGSKKMMKQ